MRRAALAFSLAIAACAAPPPAPEAPSLRPAFDALVVGKTTKAEARAALGQAVEIDFDSGYEVWVYRERRREKQPPPATEFVLLFAPSGILARTRLLTGGG